MYFGGSLRGKLIILLKIFWGNLVIKLFNLSQHYPPPPPLFVPHFTFISLSPSWPAAPSLYFSIFLSCPPTEAHTPTHSSSLYFSHSLTGEPAIYHRFWRISLENPIRNPIHSIISNFKGKTLLTILVAFQVVVRFLSNLSYLSDIHVIEYMGFWFGGLNC